MATKKELAKQVVRAALEFTMARLHDEMEEGDLFALRVSGQERPMPREGAECHGVALVLEAAGASCSYEHRIPLPVEEVAAILSPRSRFDLRPGRLRTGPRADGGEGRGRSSSAGTGAGSRICGRHWGLQRTRMLEDSA